jgi:hypothetical protein
MENKAMLLKAIQILLVSRVLWGQQEAAPKEWGKPSGAYQLSLSSDKASYVIGEPIVVTTTLKNISDGLAPIRMNTTRLFYRMDVRLPIADWIPLSPRAAMTPAGIEARDGFTADGFGPGVGGMRGFWLQPGKERADTFQLEKLFYMTAEGAYRIVFSCNPNNPNNPNNNRPDSVIVTSNEITVVLRKE